MAVLKLQLRQLERCRARICKNCGEVYDRGVHQGAVPLFCSEACGRTWWKNNPESRIVYSLRCTHCRDVFAHHNKRTKFCSHGCANAALGISRRIRVERQCQQCGQAFTSSGSRERLFCSKSCGIRHTNPNKGKMKWDH